MNQNAPRKAKRKASANAPEFARDLERLSIALALLSRELPPRTTLRQALAFILVAAHDAARQSITLKGIQQIAGSTADGSPVIGPSIERTLDIFRQPTNRAPDALGWLEDEVDPDDRRLKYFHLTPEGQQAARAILGALHMIEGDEQ